MPKKDVNEICVKLAVMDEKLDSLVSLLARHEGHLDTHDQRLRNVEKQMHIAFGWAGAVGFLVSVAYSWIVDKLSAH